MPPLSKRKSLRFNCRKREINLKTDYEEGTAFLLNISTKGCAVVESSLEPETGEIVLISFYLEGEHGENNLVEVQAKVLRKHPQLAMQFTRIEPETESLIFHFFLKESRTITDKEGTR